MATRRPARSGGSRRGKTKLPVWLVLLLGLGLGALLMWGGQKMFYRGGKPLAGIAGLFSGHPEPPKPTPKPAAEGEAVKPHFDFYTILPEIETVLPDRPAKGGKKTITAKADHPDDATTTRDTGVVYMLQAASYANLDDADRLKARLVLNGLEARIERIAIEGKGQFFRVRLGPYARVEDLDAANQKLAAQGIKALRLKVKKGAGV
jgi:cell division protein FtsN